MGLIQRLGFRPYVLPLRRPWVSARGGRAERRGWLVWVEAGGLIGYGDCAPLPEAGTESPDLAEAALTRLSRALLGGDPARILAELDPAAGGTPCVSYGLSRRWGVGHTYPSVRYALACALADLLSQAEGLSLRHWLNPAASGRIAVNAMLGAAAHIKAQEVAEYIQRGFRVIKLKVGIAPPATELQALAALSHLSPDLGPVSLPPQAPPPPGEAAAFVDRHRLQGVYPLLRLDANGAWGLDQAQRFIEGLVRLDLPIESLEEPLAQPDPEQLARLQSQSPFPLALDESLGRRFWGLDPKQLGVRRLVLKPALVGGLRQTFALARSAQNAGLEVVITSLIDSAAGLWPTAQLAAALAIPVAHGLGTGEWLAADLGAPPPIQGGWIELGQQPGSGFKTLSI